MSSSAVRYGMYGTLILLFAIGVFSKRGWLDWRRIVRQDGELQQRIDLLRRQRDLSERQIEAFQARPAVQERVIRQVLGYVRPDETVIEFQ